jgi:hypothetical protein
MEDGHEDSGGPNHTGLILRASHLEPVVGLLSCRTLSGFSRTNLSMHGQRCLSLDVSCLAFSVRAFSAMSVCCCQLFAKHARSGGKANAPNATQAPTALIRLTFIGFLARQYASDQPQILDGSEIVFFVFFPTTLPRPSHTSFPLKLDSLSAA